MYKECTAQQRQSHVLYEVWLLMLLQDGTIGMDIKLTGILSTSVLSPGESRPSHGILVGPGVNAAAHQHLFCARLDMAVDDQLGGRDLVVSEVSASALLQWYVANTATPHTID
jgi:primary-amine oxidase